MSEDSQRVTDNRLKLRRDNPSFAFRRNSDGYPVLFWSEATKTDCIFLAAAGALNRSRGCDSFKPSRESTSVLTLVLAWAGWWAKVGDRDLVTGLRLDYSLKRHGSLTPTLVAHRVHRSRLHLGCTTPHPKSLDDFHPELLNARPEARQTNFTIKSYRYATLCAMMHEFCEFTC